MVLPILDPESSSRRLPNVSTVIPVIPSPYIAFIIVNQDDRRMIRCDPKSVVESSVELAKLIRAGPNIGRKGDNHYQVQNVDPDDFELMIGFFQRKFIKCRDHLHILRILELAERFNCPDLYIHCIRELDLQLSSATVLDVFRAIWFYQGFSLNTNMNNSNSVTTKDSKKSRSPLLTPTNTTTTTSTSESSKITNPFTPEEYACALLRNTLQLIEMQAECVLATPKINELRFEELELIVKGDALQLRTELILFNCLASWSLAECERRNMDPTHENRTRVLGPLCLVPRYLLMTTSEFNEACYRLECLPPIETALIKDFLQGKKIKNLSTDQQSLMERFRTPRPEFPKMPIHLSDRSHPRNYSKKMRQAEKKSNKEGCIERWGLNCLTVFVCIFD